MSILKIGFVTFNVIFVLNNIVCVNGARSQTVLDHNRFREKMLKNEDLLSFGGDIKLSYNEQEANKIIMRAKLQEHELGYNSPQLFNPAKHIFEVLRDINSTKLFQLLSKMPKGGILHAHDTALCSTDYLLSLTYKENLWQVTNEQNEPEFLFSRRKPAKISTAEWTLVSDIRRMRGAQEYDQYLRSLFTLYTPDPYNTYTDINVVWNKFMHINNVILPIITYEEVFREYFKRALTEMLKDNVQYLEFRGTLPEVYDLDGNVFDEGEVVKIYKTINDQFVRENPTFIGSKLIYAPIRDTDANQISNYIRIMNDIHSKFPKYVAGFDLAGQEDKGPPLIDFIEPILSLPKTVKFYFNAGETSWYGTTSDENLADAVLLGTKRIGHGFALLKHPKILERVIKDAIVIEVNPISNQVLNLVRDYRNHPAAALLAGNYPVVISSDDPSFWEVTPLTHDFYEAFLGIASKHHDLKLLKKLAQSSIFYSAMEGDELINAMSKWKVQWDKWITEVFNMKY